MTASKVKERKTISKMTHSVTGVYEVCMYIAVVHDTVFVI